MKKRLSAKAGVKNFSSLIVILPFLVTILGIFSPASAHASDFLKIGYAAEHAHQAIQELNATVNKLPDQLKDTIGSNIKLMSDNVNQIISRINDQTVPLLNDSMKTQLNHIADLTNSLTDQLNGILKNGVTQINQDTAARLNQLLSMTHDTLNQVQGMIQADIELVGHSVYKVWKQTDAVLIRVINKWVYDGVRFANLFLFLIGLLLLGLRLQGFLEKRITFKSLLRENFTLSFITFCAIGIFLGTTLYLGIYPGNLAQLSARIHRVEEEHPCKRLKIQQDHLEKAKKLGDEGLITATLDRIKRSYEECFQPE
jgi:hypothetical protein